MPVYLLTPALRGEAGLVSPRTLRSKLSTWRLHICNQPLETQLPTCQHFIICLSTMGHLSMGEHFPHQHAKGPNIGLRGEIALQDGLRGHPTQRHPGLAEVVVLTVGKKHTQGWGGASPAHWIEWGTRPGIPTSAHVWVSYPG